MALLRDPTAAVWHDHDHWLELMTAHGWQPGAIGWDGDTHPANRRSSAAEEWGADNGIGDWHRLRELGLIA